MVRNTQELHQEGGDTNSDGTDQHAHLHSVGVRTASSRARGCSRPRSRPRRRSGSGAVCGSAGARVLELDGANAGGVPAYIAGLDHGLGGEGDVGALFGLC